MKVEKARTQVQPKRKRSLSWGSTDAEKWLHDQEWQNIKDSCKSKPVQEPQQQSRGRSSSGIKVEKKRKLALAVPPSLRDLQEMIDSGNESGSESEKENRKRKSRLEKFFFQIPPERRVGRYLLLEELGGGAGGSIYKAKNITSGQVVAIKVIHNNNNSTSATRKKVRRDAVAMKRGRREASVMEALGDNKRVVKLIEVVEESNRIAIVMELAEGGDLLNYIQYEKKKRQKMGFPAGGLPREEAWRLFKQIVEGLSHTHSSGFVHRDLKPENIFLDRHGNALLGDWGYGTGWSPFRPKSKSCGSLNYVAPEILCGASYIGPEIDIFALGVVLFAMLCGSLPFGSTTNRVEKLQRVLNGDWGRNNPNLTPMEVELLDRMFDCDALKRATMYDVVEYVKMYSKGNENKSCQLHIENFFQKK